MVRLHTINTLRCNRKDVDEGRLSLEATKVDVREESAFDREFLVHLLPTLEWPSLRDAARAVGVTLPDALDDALKTDEAFLRALHHILFDVHVVEGSLRCVESGQVFPISDGRPNMMLPEEVV